MSQRPACAWHGVNAESLHAHQYYYALPETESDSAPTRLLRQSTAAWRAAHVGRLTGSRIHAFLGLLDSEVAARCRVPRHLRERRHAIEAHQHLQQSSVGSSSASGYFSSQIIPPALYVGLRTVAFCDLRTPSVAPWRERNESRCHTASLNTLNTDGAALRLEFGKHLEPTALLAAIDMLLVQPKLNGRLLEIGLCNLEDVSLPASMEGTELPPIGASPDGVLLLENGSVEAVEVKCPCPFVVPLQRTQQSGLMQCEDTPDCCCHGFMQREQRSILWAGIPAWCIPQLMLEVVCLGPLCTGANYVVLTKEGAACYWVQRNNDYISLLLRLVAHQHSYGRRSGRAAVAGSGEEADAPNLQPRIAMLAQQARRAEKHPGAAPPSSWLQSHPAYPRFVDLSISLARNAVLKATLGGDAVKRLC